MAIRPDIVTICGIPYNIEYCRDLYDVDQSANLGGVIRYQECQIKVLDRGQPREHVWQVLIHEVLHGLADSLGLKCFQTDDGHEELDRLATGINDILIRNGWLNEQFGLGNG